MPVPRISNDEGVAYTFAMIVISLFVLAFLWALCIPMINAVLNITNARIEAGQISAQTAAVIDFNIGIYQYFPAFVLGAMLLLAIVVALYHRRTDYA